MDEKITLTCLQERIKSAVDSAVAGYIWITAEIGEIKRNSSGHWYLELVDYDQAGLVITAKARATVWARTAAMLMPFFTSVAGSPLAVGMHVMLKVQVQYSAVYALSLNVVDIDPAFTVGELQLQRQQIINRLQQEEMFGLNSRIPLPLLPKKIAVVSSESAAGYRDFMKHISPQESGVSICTRLFTAPMQGNEAPQGIIGALDRIAQELEAGESFDAVVIIRGGGGAIELACFDDYELALNIAQFPIPVLTGIGHDHDFHIADMVAHTYLKTPTAVADFIIGFYQEQAARLEQLGQRCRFAVASVVSGKEAQLVRLSDKLKNSLSKIITDRENKLKFVEYKIAAANPLKILQNGFVIATDKEGRRLVSVGELEGKGSMKLFMKDGVVEIDYIIKNGSGYEKDEL